MDKVCAWCEKDLGSIEVIEEDSDCPITHGICGDCTRKMLSYEAESLREYLNQFSKPVFLVDKEGRVVTGNNDALSFLNKKHEEIEGKLGGDVFGCKFADLPGGCGNTIHCKTCTIRNAVRDTLESGKVNYKVPAYPDLHQMTGEKDVRFLITTELVEDGVLLRIDDVTVEEDS